MQEQSALPKGMRLLATMALLAAQPLAGQEPIDEQQRELAASCASAHDPKLCLESFGFRCDQNRRPSKSITAQHLGCNLDLGDGRYHFVQMLFDDGAWTVEVQKTYYPDYDEPRWPEQDSSLALSNYIKEQMSGYSMQSSSSGATAHGQPQEILTGAHRVDRRLLVGAACGAVIGLDGNKSVEEKLAADCEHSLSRSVKALSQSQAGKPYRVAGSSDFEWARDFVRLVSGDSALVITGHYQFAEVHTPCRWISDCCAGEGVYYLGSCRVLSDAELQSVQACLTQVESHRSDEFQECLRAEGVRAGCERQADGSSICY